MRWRGERGCLLGLKQSRPSPSQEETDDIAENDCMRPENTGGVCAELGLKYWGKQVCKMALMTTHTLLNYELSPFMAAYALFPSSSRICVIYLLNLRLFEYSEESFLCFDAARVFSQCTF